MVVWHRATIPCLQRVAQSVKPSVRYEEAFFDPGQTSLHYCSLASCQPCGWGGARSCAGARDSRGRDARGLLAPVTEPSLVCPPCAAVGLLPMWGTSALSNRSIAIPGAQIGLDIAHGELCDCPQQVASWPQEYWSTIPSSVCWRQSHGRRSRLPLHKWPGARLTADARHQQVDCSGCHV